MTENYCGLDFGTSNSTLGLYNAHNPYLIPLESNSVTLPSAIFFHFENDQIFYGRQAINEYIDGEFGRLMRSLKSVLGTSLMDDTTQIKNTRFAFTDIISQFILEMKVRGERAVNRIFERVVLGRPVHFIDDDAAADREAQNALEEAAKKAGFNEVLFQYEPIAAALDYEREVTKEEIALIIDLGGGTSDFSVVRLSPQRAHSVDRKNDILSNGGVHVGGTDFDKKLSVKTVMPHFGYKTRFKGEKALELPAHYHHDLATWHKIHFLYQRKIFQEIKSMLPRVEAKNLLQRFVRLIERRECHRLAIQVENSKIALTESLVTEMDLNFVEHDLAIQIQRQTFDDAIISDVEKVLSQIQSVVSQAGLKTGDITRVFMTGGSTSIPLIRASIRSLLPTTQFIDGDMFGSVGIGLAIDAGRKFN